MKRLLVVFLLGLHVSVYSQLLVVQLDSDGKVQPLSDEITQDSQKSKKILDILLKYTWPSCIAHDLTDEEKRDLLSSQQGAEKNFVRKKLQQIDNTLDVVFIPTTLYELFFIGYFMETFLEDCLNGKPKEEIDFDDIAAIVDIIPILNSPLMKGLQNLNLMLDKGALAKYNKSSSEIKDEIDDEYNKFNRRISDIKFPFVSNILLVHQAWIKWMFDSVDTQGSVSVMKLEQDVYDARVILKQKLIDMIQKTYVTLLSKKKMIPQEYNSFKEHVFFSNTGQIFNIVKKLLPTENTNHIVDRVIDFEYEAYKTNKGILLRGASSFKAKNIFDEDIDIIAVTQKPKNYSISFGNSLLAGSFCDINASAYYYLVKDGGYGIFIDKSEYMDNYCSNLFFISGLATEVALFGQGEMFHSRSKPAIRQKELNKQYAVTGLMGGIAGGIISDPYGFLLITRDPIRQEYLFSKYLLENVVEIASMKKGLFESEQISFDILKEGQKDIQRDFFWKDWFPRWEKIYRKKQEDEKRELGLQGKKELTKKHVVVQALDLSRAVYKQQIQRNGKIKKDEKQIEKLDTRAVARTLDLARAVNVRRS